MVTLKTTFRQLIPGLFICMLFFSCQKNLDTNYVPIDPQEFINYSVNGVDYAYAAPNDMIALINPANQENPTFINRLRVHSTGQLDGNYSVVTFDSSGIGLNSYQPLGLFGVTILFTAYDVLFPQNPVSVHITEYGQIGEFISGNFHGVLFDAHAPNMTYNVACSFRVRRTF